LEIYFRRLKKNQRVKWISHIAENAWIGDYVIALMLKNIRRSDLSRANNELKYSYFRLLASLTKLLKMHAKECERCLGL
jgi:hypothetical protein